MLCRIPVARPLPMPAQVHLLLLLALIVCAGRASAQSFTVSTSPTSITVSVGSAGTTTVSIAPTGGFSSAVSLSSGGYPPGVSASFSPSTISGTQTSTMTITVSGTASTGTDSIPVFGSSGSLFEYSYVSVTIVASQTLTSILVTPASGPVALNTTQSYTATGKDQNGNTMVPEPTFTWSVASGVGSVNSTGLFSAGSTTGSSTIKAVSGSVSGTATATVVNGPPTIATAAAASPSPVTGTSTVLSVLGADPGGQSGLTYTWSTTGSPPAAASFSPNGTNAAQSSTATFTKAGSYSLLATVTDPAGLTATSPVTVAVNQTPNSIALSPATATAAVGSTQQFTASELDQFGTALTSQPSFTYSVSGGGTINPSTGLFTATTAGGPFTVTGTAGPLHGTSTVTVNVVPGFTLTASPGSVTVPEGGTAASTISLSSAGGFASAVSLTTGQLPSGVLASFSTTYVAGSATSVLTLTSESTAPTGTSTLTVTGTSGSLVETCTVGVTVAANTVLSSIVLSPTSETLLANGSQQFTASAKDQFGNSLTSQPGFTWSVVSGGVGSISSSGLFSAGSAAGYATVAATSGTVSGYSPVTVAAPAPTGLAAFPNGNQSNLTWNLSTGASSYNVYRGTAPGAEGTTSIGSSGSSSYTDSGLTSGTAYYYKVTAVYSGVESPKSAEASDTAGSSALAAPVDVAAIGGTSQVVLNWSGVSGATSYNVYRGVAQLLQTPGGISYVLNTRVLYQSNISATTLTDTGVINGTPYGYFVCAVNSAGQGASSSTAYAIPGATSLSAPTALVASSAGSLNLAWNAVPNAQTYNVYRGTSAGTEGGSPVASVAGHTVYNDSGLTSGTTYYYKVTAEGYAGESAKSNEASGAYGSTALSAPTTISADSGSGQVTLNWSAVSGATSYNIYRGYGLSSGSSYSLVDSSLYQSGITATNYVDTGVANGTEYGYYVCGVNTSGQGNQSATVWALPGGTPLPAPTGLSVSASASPLDLVLSWTAVTGSSGYNVYRALTPGGEGSVPTAAAGGTSYTDSVVAPATTYFYKVTTVSSAGESAKSAEAWGTTPGFPSSGIAIFPSTPYAVIGNPGKAAIALSGVCAANFSGLVNLSISGAPSGVSIWCYAPSFTMIGSENCGEGANLWIAASPSAAPGSYLITVTATADPTASYACANTITLLVTIT